MLIEIIRVMNKAFLKLLPLLFIFQLFSGGEALAQENTNLTSDELFTQARNVPKEKANYPKIIEILKSALVKSPDYADIRLFLGRIYTWNDNLDSARFQFNQVLAKDAKNIEAYSALFDVEYWNDNYARALDHANMGLLQDPSSAELSLKKAKALNALKDSRQALSFLKKYNKLNPEQDTTKSYYSSLMGSTTKNAVSAGYEFVYFDERFNDPWHFSSIGYTRKTAIGSVSGNLIYSNRFKTDGLQGEIEAYPSIAKNIYAYVGAAFSKSSTFPVFRSGISLYYSLPKSFDAETGFRYLDFSPSKTYIYVLALGKYSGNFYFNLKTYITPSDGTLSHSYTFSTKYYLSDRYNVIGAQIGTGISPDDLRNVRGIGNLHTYKLGVNYSRDLVKNLTLSTSGLWFYEEYRPQTWGNQFGASISISRRF